MKKAHLLLLIVLIVQQLAARAQAPAIQWQQCIGGSDYEGANCISPTADGGFIAAGSTYSTDGNLLNAGVKGWQGDCFVAKISSAGSVSWVKAFGGFSGEQVMDVKQTSDGGYIAVGITSSTDGDFAASGAGGWLMRLASDGSIAWVVNAGSMCNAVQQTADGGFVTGGGSYVRKFNSTGIMEWNYDADYIIRSVGQTSDGGFIASGAASTFRGNDFGVLKLTNAGNLEQEKYFGGFGDDDPSGILQTTDGGYIVAGTTSSNNTGDVTGYHGGTDCWVVKLDNVMNIIWKKAYGGTMYERAWGIRQVSGGYIVAGEAGSEDGDVTNHKGGNSDAWVIRLNNAGDIEWQKCIGGSDWEIAKGVARSNDGGYSIVGMTMSNDGDVSGLHGVGGSLPDLWVAKFAQDIVLPVAFGSVEAYIKNNTLTVNWNTQMESNNAYFLVESSSDGHQFSPISSKILTKAPDGHSSVPLHYQFSKALPVLEGMAVFFLFSMAGRRRRHRLYVSCLLVVSITFFALSCKKDSLETSAGENQRQFIRVTQVNKDGGKSHSAVIPLN